MISQKLNHLRIDNVIFALAHCLLASVSLATIKSRVVPRKSHTLQIVELLSADVGAKLARHVRSKLSCQSTFCSKLQLLSVDDCKVKRNPVVFAVDNVNGVNRIVTPYFSRG